MYNTSNLIYVLLYILTVRIVKENLIKNKIYSQKIIIIITVKFIIGIIIIIVSR